MSKKAVDVRSLNMWKQVYDLVAGIYQATGRLSEHELFGLAPQIRRSAVLLITHLSEAFEHEQVEEKLRCTALSKTALSASRYYLTLAAAQDFRKVEELTVQAEKVSMLLEMYKKTLRK